MDTDQQLNTLLERGALLMKADEPEFAFEHYRDAYGISVRRLAASTPQTESLVRAELLRCHEHLAACHERMGELGPAWFAVNTALELATALGHPEAELEQRRAHAADLQRRLDAETVD